MLKAEIVHAVRKEMAVTLEDVILRRTDMATGRQPAEEELAACAAAMARELDWDNERRRSEIVRLRSMLYLPDSFETPQRELPPPPHGSEGIASRTAADTKVR